MGLRVSATGLRVRGAGRGRVEGWPAGWDLAGDRDGAAGRAVAGGGEEEFLGGVVLGFWRGARLRVPARCWSEEEGGPRPTKTRAWCGTSFCSAESGVQEDPFKRRFFSYDLGIGSRSEYSGQMQIGSGYARPAASPRNKNSRHSFLWTQPTTTTARISQPCTSWLQSVPHPHAQQKPWTAVAITSADHKQTISSTTRLGLDNYKHNPYRKCQ
jgi:hypothetical protein